MAHTECTSADLRHCICMEIITLTSNIEQARACLERGGRVIWVANNDSALIKSLGSKVTVGPKCQEQKHPLWPHVLGFVSAYTDNVLMQLKHAYTLSGGTPLLYSASEVVCTKESIGAGELYVVPDFNYSSYADRNKNKFVNSIYNVTSSEISSELHASSIQEITPQWDVREVNSVAALTHGGLDEIAAAAMEYGQKVDPLLYRTIKNFARKPSKAGALLVRGCPVGDLPSTPSTPHAKTGKDNVSEFSLLTVSKLLGHPVGYKPEHGGSLVQNVVPTRSRQTEQISTSSKVDLYFHVEAAFHPHLPRWLALLCLKGDPLAKTTLVSVHDIKGMLSEDVLEKLSLKEFKTGVDTSYTAETSKALSSEHSVLSGSPENPRILWDWELTVGTTQSATDALSELKRAASAAQASIVLKQGDLLLLDNTLVVHGRSPFSPRFDGTDRWLQRSLIVSSLDMPLDNLVDGVVSTEFL